MLLAIDIGNTSLHCGLFERQQLAKQARLPTQPSVTPPTLTRQFRVLARRDRLPLAQVTRTLICSVVPSLTGRLERALRGLVHGPIRVVGRDLHVPLRNRYRHPEQVGQDRLVGAYAAWRTYGKGQGAGGRGRGKDCLVADFGTAITIDLVTASGAYEGGVIAPGLAMSLEALAERTALLPRVMLATPKALLGRDTAGSILAGVMYGGVALCDGLIEELKRRYAPRALVIVTGGGSRFVVKYLRGRVHVRPTLVLDGLLCLDGI